MAAVRESDPCVCGSNFGPHCVGLVAFLTSPSLQEAPPRISQNTHGEIVTPYQSSLILLVHFGYLMGQAGKEAVKPVGSMKPSIVIQSFGFTHPHLTASWVGKTKFPPQVHGSTTNVLAG